MKLLVDAGNSRIKWAAWKDGRLVPGMVLDRNEAAPTELFRKAWGDVDRPPEAVVVANVAGDSLKRSLSGWVRRNWGLSPRFVRAEAEACGVRNAYADPRGLGVDRWAALIGARHRIKGDLFIVDCGTALTLDALDRGGRHLGGLILPGLALMRQSLVDRAEGIDVLPSLAEAPPGGVLATDTAGAIIGGSLYAAVATIDRLLGDLRTELGRPVTCVVTGGDAEAIMGLLSCKPRHEPWLVLEGLARLAAAQAPAEAEASASEATA